MSEKPKEVCRTLNYFDKFLIFVSAVSGSVLISAFDWLVSFPVGTTISAVGLKMYAIITRIEKYKSIIKKKSKKHNHAVLLAKNKLTTIDVFISKALNDSYINHDESVSVNNVLR